MQRAIKNRPVARGDIGPCSDEDLSRTVVDGTEGRLDGQGTNSFPRLSKRVGPDAIVPERNRGVFRHPGEIMKPALARVSQKTRVDPSHGRRKVG